MENFDVAITLKVPEWNYIMAALGQRPYGEVAVLVAKMRLQADDQLKHFVNEQPQVVVTDTESE